MKRIIYVVIALFVVACATKKPASTPATPSPSATSSSNVESVNPFTPKMKSAITAENFKSSIGDYTFADFSKGKSIYETNCDKCHALKDPKSFSSADWTKHVPQMVKMFNKKFGTLDAKSEELILNYGLTAIELK